MALSDARTQRLSEQEHGYKSKASLGYVEILREKQRRETINRPLPGLADPEDSCCNEMRLV